MEITKVYAGDKEFLGWICNKCKRFWQNEQFANECCLCIKCKKNERISFPAYYESSLYCEDCLINFFEKLQENKQKEMEKLEEATTWEYLLFNGKMFTTISDVIKEAKKQNIILPKYLHLMKPVYFNGFDLERHLLEPLKESAIFMDNYPITDNLKCQKDLEKAIKKFNKINKYTILYWEIDKSKKVKIIDY